MKPVREIVSRDVIEDLWGAGYTILPRFRHPDPFHVPPEIVPQGRSYQWMHLIHDKFHYGHGGWAPVPASRHDGYFMPAGHVGDIEVSGCGLFEKPKFEVDAERAQQVAAAHKQVDDWKDKWGAQFSGEVTVGGSTQAVGFAPDIVKNLNTKTIDTTFKVPKDMVPYIDQVLLERDALYADLVDRWNSGLELTEQQDGVRKRYEEALKTDRKILKGPTLNALLLPFAVENIRKQIAEEATSGKAS